MFTGIIEEIGSINRLQRSSHSCVLEVKASKILDDIHLGDSIAVNGICLTVTSFRQHAFTVDVMTETWNRSSLKALKIASAVNLERALPVNGRLGGHLVTGHIDGTGTIKAIQPDSNAVWFEISASPTLLTLIVEKGSIAIDGISLTVARVSKTAFWVSVIPHTLKQTILKDKRVHDLVNLENDLIGKYIQKLLSNDSPTDLSDISQSYYRF